MLEKCTKWGDSRTNPDHENIGIQIPWGDEVATVRTGQLDDIPRLRITQIIRSNSRKAFPADLIDIEATPNTERNFGHIELFPLARAGDGIEPEMMFISKRMWSWNQNADALTFQMVKGGIRDIQCDVPYFVGFFIGDPVASDNGCFVGVTDVVFGEVHNVTLSFEW
jgi:hypothetical protein